MNCLLRGNWREERGYKRSGYKIRVIPLSIFSFDIKICTMYIIKYYSFVFIKFA